MNGAAALFLGVDGGGTGCRARLEDSSGVVLGLGQSGPATARLGLSETWDSVREAFAMAIAEARLEPPDLSRIRAAVGIAGIRRKGIQEQFAALAHPFASLRFMSDGLIACLGAHSGKDGGIVIVGTGSIGIARVNGHDLSVGGYGFPISDEGSGADLGLDAIRLAMRALDGRAEGSPLATEILGRFHDDPFEVVAWMDRATATDCANFAPLVLRYAEQGDSLGRRIVQAGAEKINGLVLALIERGVPRIALIGGMANAIEAWLTPDVRHALSPPEGDAISGAIILARQDDGFLKGDSG
ncbi:MAG TPA: BadF/BadG/BcrA/BcrD ATPase family protein [Methylocella sp.]|jgi:glucosamine kinase